MAKYILVEVANREINNSVYDNLETAKSELHMLFDEACDCHNVDTDNPYDCWINEDYTGASITLEDVWLDWTIIEV